MANLPDGVKPIEEDDNNLGDPAKFTWQENDEPETKEEKTADADTE